MKKRNIFGTLVALGVATYLFKFTAKMMQEIDRYNHIRSLSDEGPVMEETPDMLLQIATQERHFVMGWFAFLKALPHDIARYTKIESM